MSKISAVVNTKNAAKSLKSCLASLDFVDEIIVADMHSQDETRIIAKQHNAVVVMVPESNHVEMVRNQSVEKAKHPWVLVIDADEQIPMALKERLLKLASDRESTVCAYALARQNIVFGAWIEHSGWWPDYQIRFFKNGTVSWDGKIHEQPIVSGSIEKLPANSSFAIQHSNYESIDDFFARLQRYTKSETNKSTARASTAITSTSITKTFFDDFFRRYYLNRGYKDGLHGTSLSLLQSFYQLTTQLRIWESQQFNPASEEISDAYIAQLLRDWQYWRADARAQQTSGIIRLYWLMRKKLRL